MEFSPEETLNAAVALLSTWGLQVLGAIAVLILGWWIAGRVRKAAARGLERGNVDPSLVPFLSGIFYYTALAVVVIAALNLFGVETTSLVAVLGAAGLAIGLALQGTLSNFSAGVMLLLFRPFKQGDYVKVGGTAGSVAEVGVFSTHLDTPDNVRIIVPNAQIFGAVIENFNHHETRRNDLVVGVSYGDDLDKAIGVVHRVLQADDRVLSDPAPVVFIAGLGDSSVNIGVRPWCRGSDYWPLRWDLTKKLKEELEAAGCSIPFPQRDLHVYQHGNGLAA